jgi:hypothetical protein
MVARRVSNSVIWLWAINANAMGMSISSLLAYKKSAHFISPDSYTNIIMFFMCSTLYQGRHSAVEGIVVGTRS